MEIGLVQKMDEFETEKATKTRNPHTSALIYIYNKDKLYDCK